MSRAYRFALLIILTATTVHAQNGRWVTHDRDIDGLGVTIHAVGETAMIVTRETSANLRFFDVLNGAWVETDLPAQEEWIVVEAEGHLALAISDDYGVAYSAMSATAHVLQYDGELLENYYLNPTGSCGRWLAYIVTDTHFYVFDADLDGWQAQPYTLPVDHESTRAVVKDDYVGVALLRPYGETSPNYAYSLPHHAFAQTDHGAPYGPDGLTLDHGFADTDNISSALGFVGYSAITNTFSRFELPAGWGVVDYRSADHNGKSERTVFAVSCGVAGGNPIDHHFWGYDTIRGQWTHDQVTYDYHDYSYSNDVQAGGRYAVSTFIVDATQELGYRVYSGYDGTVTTYMPGLYNGYDWHVTGGSVYVAAQRDNMAWGLDVETGNTATLPLSGSQTVGLRTEAQDFVLFSRYIPGGDTMSLHAYHGPTNAWSQISLEQITTSFDNSGSHCYAYIWMWDDVEAAFYSGHHGTFVQTTFPFSSTRPWWRSDHLAALWTENGGCLYDARRHQLHMMDYEFDPSTSIGQAVFVGADDVTQTAWGYSELTGAWSSAPIGDTPRVGAALNHVGWVGDQWPTENLLAFNGFYGNWVPQVLVGHTSQIIEAGGRTILVVDAGTMYAFDPQAPALPLDDPGPGVAPPQRPAKLALHPVHPNPFNPSTQFAFDLPRPGPFTLRVHDLRGRVVRTLSEGAIPAGTHTATWNGRDDAERTLPSGTYVIRLEAEGHAATQRATLLK